MKIFLKVYDFEYDLTSFIQVDGGDVALQNGS